MHPVPQDLYHAEVAERRRQVERRPAADDCGTPTRILLTALLASFAVIVVLASSPGESPADLADAPAEAPNAEGAP